MVTWHQENPPPSGVAYEWAGTPHASESIKYIDGVEVARNLSTNPSFETGLHGVREWTGVSVSRSSATSGWYPYGSRLMFVYYEDGRSWSARVRPADVDVTGAEGKYVAVAVSTRRSGSANVDMARVSLNFSDDSWVYGPLGGITTSWDRQTVVGQIPASSTYVTPVIQVESSTEPSALNVTFGVDGVHVAIADTEAEALAQIEEYFDGSFEDDRAGDVWFRTSDRAAFYWDGAERGWVPHTWDRVFHPLNGTEYAWAGEPHASESIKYVGGVEVARNLSKNPSFETNVSSLQSRTDGTRIQRSSSPNSAASGDYHSRITFNGDYPNAAWPYVWEDVDVTAGKWLSVEMFARSNVTTAGFTAGIRIEFRSGSGQVSVANGSMRALESRWMGVDLDNPNRDTLTTIVPSTATFARIGYRAELNGSPSGLNGSGLVMFTDALRFQLHSTEGEAAEALSKGYFDGDTPDDPSRSGVAEAGVSTVARRGLVGETFARSREKINLQLAEPDERLKGGERIELAAFAASSSEVTWRWRQITGPEVFLVREGNTCHFQAPDVDNLTDMRIAVTASSVDGANRADWHYFDLEIRPAAGRFAVEGSDGFLPYTPQMVGYNRGKREIWNDVIAPVGMDPEGRKKPKLVDLGIPADDVTFVLDGEEPARASAGAVYVDIQDGAIYRNFGGGYNETDDTTGAPRLNAYMVNPATGEVFEWIEGADNGR